LCFSFTRQQSPSSLQTTAADAPVVKAMLPTRPIIALLRPSWSSVLTLLCSAKRRAESLFPGRIVLLRYVSQMSAEHQTRATCERCGLPCVELDAYGERLRGCLGCNHWWDLLSGEWRSLPDEDIAALRGVGTAWRRPIGLGLLLSAVLIAALKRRSPRTGHLRLAINSDGGVTSPLSRVSGTQVVLATLDSWS
jgi:hypothetical protein